MNDCAVCGTPFVETAYGLGHIRPYDMKRYATHRPVLGRAALPERAMRTGPLAASAVDEGSSRPNARRA